MIFFQNDDQGYFAWIADNPDGFVVNVRAKHDPAYTVLHRSQCPMISKTSHSSGAFTERSYRKVCVTNSARLSNVAQKLGRPDGSFSKRCQICSA